MSIAQIARFSATYASFAKLELVSSRGTSRVGPDRALPSGMPQEYGIPPIPASRFLRPGGGGYSAQTCGPTGGAPVTHHSVPRANGGLGCVALHPPTALGT